MMHFRYASLPALATLVVLFSTVHRALSEGSATVPSPTTEDNDSRRRPREKQLISIISPVQGQTLTGSDPEVIVRVSSAADESSLLVRLNGKEIGQHFHRRHCADGYCKESASVSPADGLHRGNNVLNVHVRGMNQGGEWQHLSFDWYSALGDANSNTNPVSVIFSTLKPGGSAASEPWIQVGTQTFPQAANPYCAASLQVIDLDRSDLTEKAYKCFSDASTMQSFLATLTTSDLVIVGTTTSAMAPPGLNTIAIGGTDYSNSNTYPAAMYPKQYMAVGVGRAAAGGAFESYSINPAPSTPFQSPPDVEGYLAQDGSNHYNFHASAAKLFAVSPNDPASGTTTVTIDGDSYNSPGKNGFWLLLLDRVSLQPIDLSPAGPCESGAAENKQCGQFFTTGGPNAAQAMDALGAALNAANPRDLVILTTAGTPIPSAVYPTLTLERAVDVLGGPGYTLHSLPVATYPTLTLVSAKDPSYGGPLTGKTVVSSGYYSKQGQTGYVRGLMTQDNHSLFGPGLYSQDNADNVANGSGLDYSYYQLVNRQPGAWPFMDTPGRVAAYQQLSFGLLNKIFSQPSGHLYDIRYFYTGSQNTNIATSSVDFKTAIPYPGSSLFSLADWSDVANQLAQEKEFLNQSITFFQTGTTALGSVLLGSDDNSLQLLQAAGEVQASVQQPAAAAAVVNLNMSNILNLGAGIVSAAATVAAPEVVVPFLGLAASVLGSSSAIAGGFTNGTDNAQIPSPDNRFPVTLALLAGNASMYQGNLQNAFDTSLDNIYSDWFKLSTAGKKTVDSTAGGWYLPNQNTKDYLKTSLQAGALRSFVLQAIPNYYGMDFYSSAISQSPSQIGSWKYYPAGWITSQYEECDSYYGSQPQPAQYSYYYYPLAHDDQPPYDFMVIGGQINNDNTSNVSEEAASQSFLNTLFQNNGGDLSLPFDEFYAPSGPLARRPGPRYYYETDPNFQSLNQPCYNIGERLTP